MVLVFRHSIENRSNYSNYQYSQTLADYLISFQLIIFGSWVFAFVFQLPQLLKKEFNRKINPHLCINTWSEKWVNRGFFLAWLVFFVVCTTLMAGLYSRIVHALWFKREQDNSVTCHQQVRKCAYLLVILHCPLKSKTSQILINPVRNN